MIKRGKSCLVNKIDKRTIPFPKMNEIASKEKLKQLLSRRDNITKPQYAKNVQIQKI